MNRVMELWDSKSFGVLVWWLSGVGEASIDLLLGVLPLTVHPMGIHPSEKTANSPENTFTV